MRSPWRRRALFGVLGSVQHAGAVSCRGGRRVTRGVDAAGFLCKRSPESCLHTCSAQGFEGFELLKAPWHPPGPGLLWALGIWLGGLAGWLVGFASYAELSQKTTISQYHTLESPFLRIFLKIHKISMDTYQHHEFRMSSWRPHVRPRGPQARKYLGRFGLHGDLALQPVKPGGPTMGSWGRTCGGEGGGVFWVVVGSPFFGW